MLENLSNLDTIFSEFRRVLKRPGRIIISLDNQLFSVFTFNKHTIQFYRDLFHSISLPENVSEHVLQDLSEWCNVDSVKELKRPMQSSEIDRHQAEIPKFNPLNVGSEMRKFGFQMETLRYFNVHPIPPRFEKDYPDICKEFALNRETADEDWRGGVLCNQMLIQEMVD